MLGDDEIHRGSRIFGVIEQSAQGQKKLVEGLERSEDLRIEGVPEAGLVAIASDTVDLFQLADEMRLLGWYLQVQPGREGIAPTLHFTVTPVSEGRIDALLEDLEETIRAIKKEPRIPVSTIMPQRTNSMDSMLLPDGMLSQLLVMAGIEGGRLPDRMADIHELMRLLPDALTEKLFIDITNDLFMPEKAREGRRSS